MSATLLIIGDDFREIMLSLPTTSCGKKRFQFNI